MTLSQYKKGIKGTRTLKRLDGDIAVVADSATLAGRKTPAAPGRAAADVGYDQLSGTMSAISRVQRSSGLPLESTVNQTIKGSISSQTPAAQGVQKTMVPLNLVTTTRIVMEPR